MTKQLSQQYTIQQGDWVSKIAKRILKKEGEKITAAKIMVYSREIANFNKIDLNRVFVGQQLDLSPWITPEGQVITDSPTTVIVTPPPVNPFATQPLDKLPQRPQQPLTSVNHHEVPKTNDSDLSEVASPRKTAETPLLKRKTPLLKVPTEPPTLTVNLAPTPSPTTAREQTLTSSAYIPSAYDLPEDERTIVICKGHGGHDPGAVTSKATERQYIEAITNRQIELLESYGYTVIEVNTSGETKLPLDTRREFKLKYPNVPIIFNHLNVTANHSATGSETFYATDTAQVLAKAIQGNLDDVSRDYRFLTNRGVKHSGTLKTIQTVDMDGDGDVDKEDHDMNISILVEYGFIDSTEGNELYKGLQDPYGDNYLTRKADAAASGIAQFLHDRHASSQQTLSLR